MNNAIRIDCLKKNYGAHAVLRVCPFMLEKARFLLCSV